MTAAPAPSRPPVRIIHMLARSGGTIIAKCLAVMPRTVMLSEVHPAVAGLAVGRPPTDPRVRATLWRFDLLHQADRWFNLLTPEDQDQIARSAEPWPFPAAVALIERRASARGEALVLRDWSHLDYIGRPFLPAPAFASAAVAALAPTFELIRFATVRHPIDQWLSLSGLPLLRDAFSLDAYLLGCRRFAEDAAQTGFVRFEDFARDPMARARELCERLGLQFDPGFERRWSTYTNVTGDISGARGQTAIALPPRRAIDPALLDRFGANADYRATIDLLGYAHP